MTPGDARWRRISGGEDNLNAEEIAEGWHYCHEFDYDLCKGDERGEGKVCCWCRWDPDEQF